MSHEGRQHGATPGNHTSEADRAYIRRLETTLNPQRQPKGPSLGSRIARYATITALATGAVLGIKKCSDYTATAPGEKARLDLASELPEDLNLPGKDRLKLDCITGRIALRCQGIQTGALRGEDGFESANCDTLALDQIEESKGPNRKISSLASAAKALTSNTGIEPTFLCSGSGADRVLKIDVLTNPSKTITPQSLNTPIGDQGYTLHP